MLVNIEQAENGYAVVVYDSEGRQEELSVYTTLEDVFQRLLTLFEFRYPTADERERYGRVSILRERPEGYGTDGVLVEFMREQPLHTLRGGDRASD